MNSIRIFRIYLLVSAITLGGALFEAYALARDLSVSAASTAWTVLFLVLGSILAGMLVLLALAFTGLQAHMARHLAALGERISTMRWSHWPVLAILAAILPVAALLPWPAPLRQLLESFSWRAAIFWHCALAGAVILGLRSSERSIPASMPAVVLAYAAIYRAAAFLPDISAYPFSLSWSEGSRYYYASLFFAEKVYGTAANPTVLHPTRYMMQAIPFLFGELPLWLHRAWQVFLWITTNAAAAWLLSRRVARGKEEIDARLIALWAFLFLFQGPIWYHLVIMIIIVLWGTDTNRFWKTLFVVLAASVWAGMSRINWIPFPAALAALLYLLEQPVKETDQGKAGILQYLFPPLVWGIAGTAAGLASQWAYAVLSGNSLDQFGSSFTSDLLWYRLWPSATYPLGIVPGILLATLPIAWIIAWKMKGSWNSIAAIRWAGLAGLLGVFFGGGLVVSVKIGGGSNLHNLDGYLALLAAAGIYFFTHHTAGMKAGSWTNLPPIVLALTIAIPAGFAISTGRPQEIPDPETARSELASLIGLVEAADGEVLFIAERQLLAMQIVDGVSLVEDYEKVFLMEMAMANNSNYLGQFKQDLAAGAFSLIITDPVRVNLQSSADQFGEENNAWDRRVSVNLLCYYEEALLLDEARVQILRPKADAGKCE